MDVGRVARLVIDPIGAVTRKYLPGLRYSSIGNPANELSLRSFVTVPASLAAYGLGASALIPDAPTPAQVEEQAYLNERANNQLATLTPYEVSILQQQAMFNEQQKVEREAIRAAMQQQAALQQQRVGQPYGMSM